ncbi:hypothetical protein Pmani_020387 [Petrolisthes manimaculis]|uniref:Interferon-related developmental regulator 1 n=1 Tax=Petrolisthes manimaculis TaxID=1843537 RepID=A0AAE1U339_9EUCA|nr:hypothetical protein Pmani_020387 [Petrolisthes manimaculis]
MPREKKLSKKAAAAAAAAAAVLTTAQNEKDEDDCSVASDRTESTAQLSDEECVSESECYEQKVRDAMDLAVVKSVHTRTNALTALTTAMQKRVLTTFLLDHHQTLSDIAERSLKKGKGAEQVAAARLINLLVLSLSELPQAEEVYKAVSGVLTVTLTDPSMTHTTRLECAHTLSVCTFIACHDLAEVMNAMNKLHSVFAASLPKGNGDLPNHPLGLSSLHTAALSGFCLLLCLLSPATLYTMANKLIKEMCDLLGQSDVDLRIQAGEGVALIYESARTHNAHYYCTQQRTLISVLQDLATDSHKFRAKRDRKHQRASFREIIKTVEGIGNTATAGKNASGSTGAGVIGNTATAGGGVINELITLGPKHARQELILDSWSLKIQYDSLCKVLNEGLNTHITYNVGVRDVFSLGPPPMQLTPSVASLTKRNHKKINRESPASKARQMTRNKNRDNRAAAKTYDD